MKKLMFAAAATAMAGSLFAGAVIRPGIYDIQFTYKTLEPIGLACASEVCNICTNIGATSGVYLDNCNRQIDGFILYCDDCTLTEGANLNKAGMILWENTQKKIFLCDTGAAKPLTVADVKSTVADAGAMTLTVYGKDANKAAVDFKFDTLKSNGQAFDLRATGLGSWNNRAHTLDFVWGSVAGLVPGDTKVVAAYGNVVNDLCAVVDYCVQDNTAGNWVPALQVPAFGTWAIRFNQAATGVDALWKIFPQNFPFTTVK